MFFGLAQAFAFGIGGAFEDAVLKFAAGAKIRYGADLHKTARRTGVNTCFMAHTTRSGEIFNPAPGTQKIANF
jgi:hypothetical protein